MIRLNERVNAFRAVLQNALSLSSTLQAQKLTETSVAQNEQVKRISSWAAIFFAPSLVAAIYGMNFRAMPELHWPLGYPFALALMVLTAFALYLLFDAISGSERALTAKRGVEPASRMRERAPGRLRPLRTTGRNGQPSSTADITAAVTAGATRESSGLGMM